MTTTSNGKSWGTNIGNNASNVFYAWIASRGIKAAARRGTEDGWETTIKTGLSVAASWFMFGGLVLCAVFGTLASLLMTVVSFFPPMRTGNFDYVPPSDADVLRKGLVCAVMVIPVIVTAMLAVIGARALVARAEGTAPRRGERVVSHFKQTWTAWAFMFILPLFAYFPFVFATSITPR